MRIRMTKKIQIRKKNVQILYCVFNYLKINKFIKLIEEKKLCKNMIT